MVVLCDDQAELYRYWDVLLAKGGEPQACGWLIDRYGLRWQIVPAALDAWMRDADAARSKRVSDAISWHEPKIRAAIEATGRKKIICAGLRQTSASASLPRTWPPKAMMCAS